MEVSCVREKREVDGSRGEEMVSWKCIMMDGIDVAF